MKPIEAHNQTRLGPGRCMQLALSGMAFRMFRSSITTAILALAVAFLVHMIVYGLISNQVQSRAYAQLQVSRQLGQILTRLTSPDSPRVILEAMGQGDARRLAEYRTWARGLEVDAFDRAVDTAKRAADFERYIATLPVASQAALVGGRAFERFLADAAIGDRFAETQAKAKALNLPPPPGGWSAIATLIKADWPAAQRVALHISEGHRQAVDDLSQSFSGSSMLDVVIAMPPDFVRDVQALGFVIASDQFADLQAFASRQRDMQVLQNHLDYKPVRQAIMAHFDIAAQDFSSDRVLLELNSPAQAQWFMDMLNEQQVEGRDRLTAEALLELSQRHAQTRRLDRAVAGYEPVDSGMPFGLPTRTVWLIVLSFLVCAVGVANAMLMSVTERFTEIATMKCLGAMDRFVMMMFVFEAVLQGFIGGVLGLVLGVSLAWLRSFIEFGSLVSGATHILSEIALAAVISLMAGVLLATLAAIGPSWVAARLAPMEAMRVD